MVWHGRTGLRELETYLPWHHSNSHLILLREEDVVSGALVSCSLLRTYGNAVINQWSHNFPFLQKYHGKTWPEWVTDDLYNKLDKEIVPGLQAFDLNKSDIKNFNRGMDYLYHN